MLSVTSVLVLIAFGLTLLNGIKGQPPLWLPVLLMTIAMLIGVLVRG
jgi:hypothetical protein